jgi:hypothetical protein
LLATICACIIIYFLILILAGYNIVFYLYKQENYKNKYQLSFYVFSILTILARIVGLWHLAIYINVDLEFFPDPSICLLPINNGATIATYSKILLGFVMMAQTCTMMHEMKTKRQAAYVEHDNKARDKVM